MVVSSSERFLNPVKELSEKIMYLLEEFEMSTESGIGYQPYLVPPSTTRSLKFRHKEAEALKTALRGLEMGIGTGKYRFIYNGA